MRYKRQLQPPASRRPWSGIARGNTAGPSTTGTVTASLGEKPPAGERSPLPPLPRSPANADAKSGLSHLPRSWMRCSCLHPSGLGFLPREHFPPGHLHPFPPTHRNLHPHPRAEPSSPRPWGEPAPAVCLWLESPILMHLMLFFLRKLTVLSAGELFPRSGSKHPIPPQGAPAVLRMQRAGG